MPPSIVITDLDIWTSHRLFRKDALTYIWLLGGMGGMELACSEAIFARSHRHFKLNNDRFMFPGCQWISFCLLFFSFPLLSSARGAFYFEKNPHAAGDCVMANLLLA